MTTQMGYKTSIELARCLWGYLSLALLNAVAVRRVPDIYDDVGNAARPPPFPNISDWHCSLRQGGQALRRQGTGGDAARENRGRPAYDHLKRGDHVQQAGYD